MTIDASAPDRRPASLRLPNGKLLSIYSTRDNHLSFKPEAAENEHRVVVISMPKAGTYLIAELLGKAGLIDLEVHLSLDSFDDYRFQTLQTRLAEGLSSTVSLGIEMSASLVRPGQFAVSHIPGSSRAEAALVGTTRVLVIRDLRDAVVSMMRAEYKRLGIDLTREVHRRQWLLAPRGPERMLAYLDSMGQDHLSITAGILPWLDDPDIEVIRFEELLSDKGIDQQTSVVERLLRKVGVQESPRQLLSSVIGKTGKTYSGARTEREEFWDSRVEQKFRELGGQAINEALSYPGTDPGDASQVDDSLGNLPDIGESSNSSSSDLRYLMRNKDAEIANLHQHINELQMGNAQLRRMINVKSDEIIGLHRYIADLKRQKAYHNGQ